MSNTLALDNRNQAQHIANRLMEYWSRRGYEVEAWVVPLIATAQGKADNVDTFKGHVVRSNLINGLPRKLLEERERAKLA